MRFEIDLQDPGTGPRKPAAGPRTAREPRARTPGADAHEPRERRIDGPRSLRVRLAGAPRAASASLDDGAAGRSPGPAGTAEPRAADATASGAREDISTLCRIAEALLAAPTREALLASVLDLTLTLVPADRAAIFLRHPAGAASGAPEPVASRERPGMQAAPGAHSRSIVDEVLREHHAVTVREVAETGAGGRATVAVPLAARLGVGGVLVAEVAAPAPDLSDAAILLLWAVGFQTGLALEARGGLDGGALAEAGADLVSAMRTLLFGLRDSLESALPSLERDPSGGAVVAGIASAAATLRGVIDRWSEPARGDVAGEASGLDELIESASLVYERWAERAGCRLEVRLLASLSGVSLDWHPARRLIDILVHHVAARARRDGVIAIEVSTPTPREVEFSVVEEPPGGARSSDRRRCAATARPPRDGDEARILAAGLGGEVWFDLPGEVGARCLARVPRAGSRP